ncbi:MAG: hypothetical protein ACYDAS_02625 [Patescibacteria group bacterium]
MNNKKDTIKKSKITSGKIKKLPIEVINTYKRFLNTPYYINKHSAKLKKPVYVGKGSPEEIEKLVYKLSGNKKISGKDRFDILKKHNIGIDCSGFITYILDSRVEKKFNTHIWTIIKKRSMNPMRMLAYKIKPTTSKMNAHTLTNNINTIKISTIKDVKPGDLIKINGGRHIAIISQVEYKQNKKSELKVSKIKYWHSTEGIGVCEGEIKIKDENRGLGAQEWIKIPNAKYQTYSLYRKKINSNGIRRLKFELF